VPAYDPTQLQSAETDTLLLADIIDLASLNASGGLIEAPLRAAQATNLAGYTFGAGPFPGTGSIKPLGTLSPSRFFYWHTNGLLSGDQFTIDNIWIKHPTLNWQAASNATLFEINTPTLTMPIQLGSAGAGIAVGWDIFPRASSVRVNKTLTIPNSALNIAAGVWASVAIVKYLNDTVRVYINGVDVGGVSGFPIPRVISTNWGNSGIRFGGTDGGPSGFVIGGKPRISRTARTPGQTPTLKSLTGAMTLDVSDVAHTAPPDFMGYVHAYPQDPSTKAVTISTGDAQGPGLVMRTNKFVNATPWRRVADGPSGTCNVLSHSGKFYVDPQVIIRSCKVLSDRGIGLYLTLDCAPEILGGPPPFSGAQLTSDYAWSANANFNIPNDIDDWADIVSDTIHIVMAQPVRRVRYSFWNEPDINWEDAGGTRASFMDFYAATANAIRAADPATPICGGEWGDSLATRVDWTNDLIAKHVATGCPLDMITHHQYTGDTSSYREDRAVLDQILVANGLEAGSIPIVWGEFNGDVRKISNTQDDPLEDFQHEKAFGAAFDVAILCEGLQDGGLGGFAFYPFSQGDPGGWVNAEFYGQDGEKFANYNAMKALKMILGGENTVILGNAGDDLPPGVYGVKTHDPDTGTTGLALASHGWAARADRDVEITLPAGTKRIQQWLVDRTHSSRRDTGDPADQDLEQTADDQVTADTVTVTVPQWGSLFITVDAGPAPTPGLFMVGGVPALAVAP
jgi:hypothetical protein